jgi:hypothetical protein
MIESVVTKMRGSTILLLETEWKLGNHLSLRPKRDLVKFFDSNNDAGRE